MRKQLMVTVLVLAFHVPAGPSSVAKAQSIGKMFVDDVSNAARDFGGIWAAPFQGSRKDWLIAGGVLAGGALVSPLDDEVDRWAVENRDRGVLDAIRPLRRGGDLYSLNKATPYVGGLYLVGLATKHRGIRDGIFGCVAAYGANTTIRHQVMYRVIGRARPDTAKNRPAGYVPPPSQHGDQYKFSTFDDSHGAHSFPGGHIATMATCASFLSNRFEMGVVEPALGVLVLAMGVGRLADQGHWLSDQVVGGAFGYAVGREVARRQKRRLAKEKGLADVAPEPADPSGPYVGRDPNGTRLGWNLTF